jgi:hypothetical protein
MPPSTNQLKALDVRILPVPHSTHARGAQISVKLAIAILVLIVVFVAFCLALCYFCVRRRRNARRVAMLVQEGRESKALKPKINRANAKFYGPGMGIGVEEVEMAGFVGEEVRRPERVRGKWREVMRGQMRGV